MYNLVRQIVHDPSLAEDIAQEAFVKAFRSLASFDASRRFSSWIFRIANNAAIDALRRRRVDPMADASSVDIPIAPAAADPIETASLRAALEAALAALRPAWRAAIVLRYQQGCSYAEIGEALGVPEGTAKTFVHRARARMAETLAAAGWRP